MFRKTMIALFAVASVSMLAPDLAWARGGGHGGGGGGGGGGRGGSFGGSFSGARAGGIGGASFSAARIGGSAFQGGAVSNSFARSTAIGPAGVQGNRFAAVQGNRLAASGFRHDHDGFRHHHGRRFFVGGFYGPGYYDDYYDYPYYTADDSYYDDGGCYVVQRRVHTRYGWRLRPVQVCG
jgi:hypothetical protein